MTEPISRSARRAGRLGIHPTANGAAGSALRESSASLSRRRTDDFDRACQILDGCIQATDLAIAVYGSARTAPGTEEYELAFNIGAALATAGFVVVTGGGPGAMEAANKGAHGIALSVGVGIELPREQGFNDGVDVAVPCQFFDNRKTVMERYTNGTVVMPGGNGTKDELYQLLTQLQTGTLEKRPVALVGGPFWGGLVDWTRDTVLPSGKIAEEDLGLFRVFDTVEGVLGHMLGHAAS